MILLQKSIFNVIFCTKTAFADQYRYTLSAHIKLLNSANTSKLQHQEIFL